MGTLDRIVCPRDRTEMLREADGWRCAQAHHYPEVGGVPILLVPESDPTGFGADALERLRGGEIDLDLAAFDRGEEGVDPVVSDAIVRTNGNLYRHLVGRLPRYPIPELRLPPGEGRTLLDLGAGWGRWSIAASRAGYRPTAVEPQIDLCLAARRAASATDSDIRVIAAGGTALPFNDDAFDVSFSYSVLQHFDKDVARASMVELARVTRPEGIVLIQLANRFGVRQLFNQAAVASGRREVGSFHVRYWTPREMRKAAKELIGKTRLEVDGYFSLNPQAADLDLLPRRYRAVVRTSDGLRSMARYVPGLRSMADSLYVRARVGR
jgi:SAM-dependent methyltransferase